MKKIFFSLIFINSILFANINAIVSILPQETFLKAIGGDKVNITVMVKPGNSPHTYEPKPSQMKAISNADIYFAIGVEFEKAWLNRFKNQNRKIKIADISKNIEKIDIEEHSHGDEKHNDHDDHDEKDPHIWTNPNNVKIIAQNIYNELIKIDTANKQYYKTNLDKFLLHIDATDKKIKSILSQKKRKLMVFHPSWGYFAKEYNLTQIAIEVEGKSPKPRELKHLIEEAREEKVNVIFTSPEFSDAIAKQIANELKIPVVKVSSLAKNWSQNLIDLAKIISQD
ncbi:MAG TPA: zinc ABC transporter substrate-binding protein [Sulfurospirillum arcachonense]|nr:zinc ABC transporter substrate-binding protein [Sulfurospirillum arcachonense]